MHKRSFFLGIGLGIIIGAILLQLILLGEASTKKLLPQEEDTSTGQLSPSLFMEQQNDQQRVDAAMKDTEVAEEEEVANDLQPSPDESSAVGLPSDDVSDKQTEQAKQYIIRIMPGETITSTAAMLYERNIISDKEKFINKMRTNKQVVRAGCFLFDEKTTVARAIEIVQDEPVTLIKLAQYSVDPEHIIIDAACIIEEDGK